MATTLTPDNGTPTDADGHGVGNVSGPNSDLAAARVGAIPSRGHSGPGAQESSASLLRDAIAVYTMVRDAAASIGLMVRSLQEAVAAAARGWQSVSTLIRDGIVWLQELPATASSYCAPYNAELRRRGMRPLSPEEETDFLFLACLIARPEELSPGDRAPLAEVALVGGRVDAAAAIWSEQLLEGSGKARFASFEREWGSDWKGEAFVGLRASVLPSIETRLNETALYDAQAMVRRVASQRYLAQCVRNYLARRLRRETRKRAAEVPLVLADEVVADPTAQGWEGYAAEQVVMDFLEREATDLDRRMVATWRAHPEWSAREVAEQLGASERTVRYRRHRMRELLRSQLAS